jgi:cobalt/nickel transport system permease protein
MHIADGILSAPVIIAGFIGTAALAAWAMRDLDLEEIPKISVAASVFFVADLIHFPLGAVSIHLVLNGLVGIVLGRRAFVAILLGVILQFLMFGHGGLTVIGVNTLMMGGGALVAYAIWQIRHRVQWPRKEAVFGALAGGVGILFSGFILALALVTTGTELNAAAATALAWHIPLVILEGAVAATCASFLKRVKPSLLAGKVST